MDIRKLFLQFVLSLSVTVVMSAHGESISEYAAACDAQIGVSVPAFDCDVGGTEILDQGTQNESHSGPCANPNYLYRGTECDPGTKFHVLHDDPGEAYIVAICRKGGAAVDGDSYNDIAVIQHNRSNGATCFYQRQDNSSEGTSHLVSDPSDPEKGGWMSPSSMLDTINCVGCHNNGPLIRSKYVNSIHLNNPLDPNTLPDFDEPNIVNQASNPYWFPGEEMAERHIATYSVSVATSSCNNCHRMSLSTYQPGDKTLLTNRFGSIGLGEVTTGDRGALESDGLLTALTPGPNDRWWMPSTATGFNLSHHFDWAQIRNCKDHFRDYVLNDSETNPYAPLVLDHDDLPNEANGDGCTIAPHPKITNQPQGLPVGTLVDEDVESTPLSLSNTGSFLWARRSGGTPSGSTGPSTGSSGSGFYYYTETSSGYAYSQGDTSSLETVLFDSTRAMLTFDYHMYGADIGTLSVDAFVDGAWTNNLWSLSGNQGNQWSSASLDIGAAIAENKFIKLRFRAVAAGGWQGDIAIDNIFIETLPLVIIEEDAEDGSLSFLSTGSHDWTRQSGATPSGGTGPSSAAGGNHYYYMETSSGHAYTSGNEAILEVPSSFDKHNMQLTFDYHMYGANVGQLLVEYRYIGGWNTTEPLFDKSGSQGNQWHQATVDLEIPVNGSINVRIRAVAAGGWQGDIAVDNILISEK